MKNMNIQIYQIDATNKQYDISIISNYISLGYLVIGFEITDSEIEQYCNINIDPQHKQEEQSRITAIEFIVAQYNNIKSECLSAKGIFICTNKPDIDSVGSMSVFILMLEGKFVLTGDIVLRLKAIAQSDRHGRANWKNKDDYFDFPAYSIYGLPISLMTMISDRKIDLKVKVDLMTSFLLFGEFEGMERYSKIAISKLDRAKENTILKTIIKNKLVFVESTFRGALGLAYKTAQVGIAKNPRYEFGISSNAHKTYGIKYTIGQYDEKYINMLNVQNDLNKIELGWGGSRTIIGSPINRPSIISEDEIIKIVSLHLI